MRKRYDLTEESKLEEDEKLDSHSGQSRDSIHNVPFYIGLIILIYLGVLYVAVYFIDGILPTPLTVSDEIDHPDDFISERAKNDLKQLTSLGLRVTGSYENEYLTVDFLTQTINTIIHEAHPNQKLESDVQLVSGSFYINLFSVNEISIYSNVQNVVVKVHGRDNSTKSILVNAHFDAVPTSPGGSDDGINVAAMLEILRKVSKSSKRPLHNIVFLFNGAEETPLQASHGFITQHKWAAECKVLINLEAAGHGGKIILFQTGPQAPWLQKYYNMVPHPYGQAAGEEIFQSGVIPSDTDFRIFRDFGGLVGLDMAFNRNGFRYHTKYDNFENISGGSYQHVGDNALSLVRNLADAPELLELNRPTGKMIFFDILGLFMISYSTLVAAILNYCTVVLSIAIFIIGIKDFKLGFRSSCFKYIGLTLGLTLSGWVIVCGFLFILGYFFDLINKTMSWYGHSWLLVGLYAVPTVGLSGVLYPFANQEKLSLNIRCQIHAHLVRLVWTLILFIGTVLDIRAMYALLVPVLFNTLAFVFIHACRWQHSRRKWQLVYLFSLIIPSVILMYQALIVYTMFVPMVGRIGSYINPEFILGGITVLFTILITSPYLVLVGLMKNLKYYYICLSVIFVAALIIVFTPLGFPYSGDFSSPTPQRYWIMHTKRAFYNESNVLSKQDSGVFFLNMDRNSPKKVESYVTDLAKAKSVNEDCEKYLACGLPLSHVKMMQIMKYSTWIPASQPVFVGETLKFTLNSKENVNSTLVRYNVTVSGSDRLGIFILPKENMTIVNTNIELQSTNVFQGRRLLYIHRVCGKILSDFVFTFDVQVPPNFEGVTTDIAVNAVYVHEKRMTKTSFFLNMIQQFPKWADVTAWIGSYESYVI